MNTQDYNFIENGFTLTDAPSDVCEIGSKKFDAYPYFLKEKAKKELNTLLLAGLKERTGHDMEKEFNFYVCDGGKAVVVCPYLGKNIWLKKF